MRSAMMSMAALLGILATGAMAQETAGNLIKNPDFSVKDSKGVVESWKTPSKQWSTDEKDIPSGCKASFKATVAEASDNCGYVQQRLKGLKKDTAYILQAKVKASMAKIAFVEIKLYDDSGKELTRMDSQRNSGTDWETLSLEFNTAEATGFTALCRYGQSKQFVGASVLFSGVRLEERK